MTFHAYWAGPLTEKLVDVSSGTGAIPDPPLDHHRHIVIAFVGMNFEARIAAGPGVLVVCRNARRNLTAVVESAVRQGYRGVISFGVAGGLAANLRAGDWVVASTVFDARVPHGHVPHATDKAWSNNLVEAIAGASYAPILGVDAPIALPEQKRELHRTTGALAVDMESHVVARLAAAHNLAFAAVRVIIDPAHRAIPSAALLGMGNDGSTEVWPVLRELAARPSQIARLAHLLLDAFAARTELQRVRQLLGPHFGFAGPVQHRGGGERALPRQSLILAR